VSWKANSKKRNTLLRLLSESIEEIFWFVEVNPERLVYISPAVERVMGWKPERFYADMGFWLACVHEDDRNRVKEAYSGWLSGTLPEYRIEFRFRLPDGRVRWMADHGALLYGERGRIQFATGIAKDISAQKQAEEDLRRLSGQLISAQEEERKRLARDLHDHVSQTLTLLTVELEQLNRDDETTPTQHDLLSVMRNQLRNLSSDLHGLSHQLHPSKLKHLGLVSAMRAMCRELERAGLRVNFSDHEVPRQLPDEVSLTLYRVMQEGLQNIRKHSGVSTADAELKKTSTFLTFRLQDQGKGFDLQNPKSGEGLGLSSMRERLNAVKGTFTIKSSIGYGTVLEASVPLPEEERFT
jgi:PAS domain S-box-containing protein